VIFRLDTDRTFAQKVRLALTDRRAIERDREGSIRGDDLDRIPFTDRVTSLQASSLVIGRSDRLSTTIFLDGRHLNMLALNLQADRPQLVFAGDIHQKSRVSLELGLVLQIGRSRESIVEAQREVLVRLLRVKVAFRLPRRLNSVGGPFPRGGFGAKGLEVWKSQQREALFDLKRSVSFDCSNKSFIVLSVPVEAGVVDEVSAGLTLSPSEAGVEVVEFVEADGGGCWPLHPATTNNNSSIRP
jgi:hypothetical protein